MPGGSQQPQAPPLLLYSQSLSLSLASSFISAFSLHLSPFLKLTCSPWKMEGASVPPFLKGHSMQMGEE